MRDVIFDFRGPRYALLLRMTGFRSPMNGVANAAIASNMSALGLAGAIWQQTPGAVSLQPYCGIAAWRLGAQNPRCRALNECPLTEFLVVLARLVARAFRRRLGFLVERVQPQQTCRRRTARCNTWTQGNLEIRNLPLKGEWLRPWS